MGTGCNADGYCKDVCAGLCDEETREGRGRFIYSCRGPESSEMVGFDGRCTLKLL
jgi:hypothetical protein